MYTKPAALKFSVQWEFSQLRVWGGGRTPSRQCSMFSLIRASFKQAQIRSGRYLRFAWKECLWKTLSGLQYVQSDQAVFVSLSPVLLCSSTPFQPKSGAEVLVYFGLRRRTLVLSGGIAILLVKRANESQEVVYWYTFVWQEGQPKLGAKVLIYFDLRRPV